MITSTQILILVLTAVALAALMYLVNCTKLGRAMRATAENPRVAALMGVRPDMVISATFIIGAALAAVAGVMWASNYGTVQHIMGFLPGPEGVHRGGVRRHRQPGRRGGRRHPAGADRSARRRLHRRRSPAACSAATTRTSSLSSC